MINHIVDFILFFIIWINFDFKTAWYFNILTNIVTNNIETSIFHAIRLIFLNKSIMAWNVDGFLSAYMLFTTHTTYDMTYVIVKSFMPNEDLTIFDAYRYIFREPIIITNVYLFCCMLIYFTSNINYLILSVVKICYEINKTKIKKLYCDLCKKINENQLAKSYYEFPLQIYKNMKSFISCFSVYNYSIIVTIDNVVNDIYQTITKMACDYILQTLSPTKEHAKYNTIDELRDLRSNNITIDSDSNNSDSNDVFGNIRDSNYVRNDERDDCNDVCDDVHDCNSDNAFELFFNTFAPKNNNKCKIEDTNIRDSDSSNDADIISNMDFE